MNTIKRFFTKVDVPTVFQGFSGRSFNVLIKKEVVRWVLSKLVIDMKQDMNHLCDKTDEVLIVDD